MEQEKRRIIGWIKKNKWKLIVAGVSITTIIAIVLGIKNYADLEKIKKTLLEMGKRASNKADSTRVLHTSEIVPAINNSECRMVAVDRIPHDVVEHLRNLPEGWKASAEKMATATERGYDLLPGQTWVEAYRTGGAAA